MAATKHVSRPRAIEVENHPRHSRIFGRTLIGAAIAREKVNDRAVSSMPAVVGRCASRGTPSIRSAKN